MHDGELHDTGKSKITLVFYCMLHHNQRTVPFLSIHHHKLSEWKFKIYDIIHKEQSSCNSAVYRNVQGKKMHPSGKNKNLRIINSMVSSAIWD